MEGLRVTIDESRARSTSNLVERLAEREERDWTCFGRLRHERERKLRGPQDVLIEADRLGQQLKKAGTATRDSTKIADARRASPGAVGQEKWQAESSSD